MYDQFDTILCFKNNKVAKNSKWNIMGQVKTRKTLVNTVINTIVFTILFSESVFKLNLIDF